MHWGLERAIDELLLRGSAGNAVVRLTSGAGGAQRGALTAGGPVRVVVTGVVSAGSQTGGGSPLHREGP